MLRRLVAGALAASAVGSLAEPVDTRPVSEADVLRMFSQREAARSAEIAGRQAAYQRQEILFWLYGTSSPALFDPPRPYCRPPHFRPPPPYRSCPSRWPR